ncbi:MAG: Gfo/Idh/MocA family protein [Propylenella sp.]
MSPPLRVGLAGAGWVSEHHLNAYAALGGKAIVVAIADPNRAAAERRAAAFGIGHVFASVEDMLSAVELDALDVAAPRETHVPICVAGVGAGLPILCQKPFAPTFEDAYAFFAAHPTARVMVHDNWRFRSHYRQIASWIRDGSVGRIRSVECHVKTSGLIRDGSGRYPALERQPMLAGLKRMLLMEVMIHHVDTLRYLLGPLSLIGCVAGKSCDAIAGEDRATLLMKDASGASVALIGDFMSPLSPPTLRDALTISGERGYIMHAYRVDTYSLQC